MAVSKIRPIPIGVGLEIPTDLINSKITASKKYLRKYGSIAAIYFEGTANANIASWEKLITSFPLGYRPYDINNAFMINVGGNLYICNMNNDGVINTIAQINKGTVIRYHAVYYVEN